MDKPIFPEIEFMRLSSAWELSSKDASFYGGVAFGGRMFQRYHLRTEKDSFLDFSYRGGAVSETAAAQFLRIMKEPHAVQTGELMQLTEVLGQTLGAHAYGRFVNQIDSAEVGAVNGRLVLAVHWHHLRFNRRVISIFYDADGDGATIREIHFSTPADDYEVTHKMFYETMRSSQWDYVAPPPPVFSVA